MSHTIDGEFKSDKYKWCSQGFMPLKLSDKLAQDLLWQYALRKELTGSESDGDLAKDLKKALQNKGYAYVRVEPKKEEPKPWYKKLFNR